MALALTLMVCSWSSVAFLLHSGRNIRLIESNKGIFLLLGLCGVVVGTLSTIVAVFSVFGTLNCVVALLVGLLSGILTATRVNSQRRPLSEAQQNLTPSSEGLERTQLNTIGGAGRCGRHELRSSATVAAPHELQRFSGHRGTAPWWMATALARRLLKDGASAVGDATHSDAAPRQSTSSAVVALIGFSVTAVLLKFIRP